MFQYDNKFYEYIEQTKSDEQIIIPLVIQWLSPKSIVDFGCAEGAWLKEALEHDSNIDILGMDGDYVNRKRLKISEENFRAVDLRQKILLDRKFDLAISTEVAEHLEERIADVFIDNIVRVSSHVLFSAAIPNQGGVHHINEQWQSYWIKKFEERGYSCDYSVRNYFWDEHGISSWRRQNLLFFSKESRSIAPNRALKDVVHPEEAINRRRNMEGKIKALEYYVLHPEIPMKLEQIIKRMRTQDKKIVIYPYGSNGRLCEKILREKYGVTDYILADNNAIEVGKTILRAEQLKEAADDIIVIDTCRDPLIHREVLEEIQKYVDEKNIYSAFKIERS